MKLLYLMAIIPLMMATKKVCPGGEFRCPDTATCCQLLDKTYGCCALENAVCCDDHIHCCPQNTKCSAGICVQNENSSLNAFMLQSQDVTCPDSQSVCPDDTTCCKDPNSDKYNCCPMNDAVCCSDGSHCCPKGTTCNLYEERCDGDGYIAKIYSSNKYGNYSSNHFAVLKQSNVEVYSVICPDSQFQCPNGYTCCKTPDGVWGCCPFSNATCCKDGIHCCPQYMTCDATSQYCSQGLKHISSLEQYPARKVFSKNVCPDNSTCSDQQTCCRMKIGFGCCSYENATCCSDLEHCCPGHQECDVKRGQCIPKRIKSGNFNSNQVYNVNEI